MDSVIEFEPVFIPNSKLYISMTEKSDVTYNRFAAILSVPLNVHGIVVMLTSSEVCLERLFSKLQMDNLEHINAVVKYISGLKDDIVVC